MESINNESLGRRIARLRLLKGMTQERLANLANVSAQAVSKWENDQSYPDIMLLPVLADVFGVSIDELLGRTVTARTIVEPDPEPEPEPEPELEPEPEPDQEPWPWSTYYSSDEPKEPSAVPAAKAPRLRIHIVDNGSDAINITVPLAAASLLSGLSNMVAGYTEGINLDGLVELVKDAEPGMLIDIDDGLDSVHISLE